MASKTAKAKRQSAPRAGYRVGQLSRSWRLTGWDTDAPDIYPNGTKRAKYLVRTHRNELVLAGALVRIGRELVIMGDRYEAWLQAQASNVMDYDIAANRVYAKPQTEAQSEAR